MTELDRYINSANFRQRYATVLARQAAGERLTPEQMESFLKELDEELNANKGG